MRHLIPSLWLVLLVAWSPMAIYAQETTVLSPELQKFENYLGEFTYRTTGDEPATGTIHFEPFAGGKFLTFNEVWMPNDEAPSRTFGVIGYDPVKQSYTWYRIFENGGYDIAEGWYEDGIFTFLITTARWEPFGMPDWTGPGVQLRTKWNNKPEQGWSFLWEKSVRGGPWTEFERGLNTRVK